MRYKILEGKAANNYYFGDYMNISREQVRATIDIMHQHWVTEIKEKGFVYPPVRN